ncbi:MAG: ribbon-helix-helix domain-containing protein [Candidatus Binataceae bacterium]
MRETINLSLPPRMRKAVDAACRRELRSRSELIREALRRYLTREIPVERPTPDELRAIARGRRELARGETVSLADYLDELAARTRKIGKKATRPHSA